MKRCKFCSEEMDLTEEGVDYELWTCMNENCNATYFLEYKNWEGEWEK